ncbi:MAG: Ig-like domain repeat protein [Verrucomicrobiota bacterium]
MKTIVFDKAIRPLCSILAALAVCATSGLVAPQVRATEAIRNGSFDSGLDGWVVNDAVGTWSPLQVDLGTNNVVSLHPPATFVSFYGYVIYQNLNLTGVGGTTLNFSVSLQKGSAPAGAKTMAVYLDYLTNTTQTTRVKILNPNADNLPSGTWTTVTASVALPAQATKVVRLLLVKEDNGEILADNVSLTTASGTVGGLAKVEGSSPLLGKYQTNITIFGTNFGATGQVFLSVSPADYTGGPTVGQLKVVSWANSQIVCQVLEPNRSGQIKVVANGVEADGDSGFFVTSSNFTVAAKSPEITAIRGQTVPAIFQVGFLNGFTSSGGVSLMMHTPPGIDTAGSKPLTQSGACLLNLNTTTLANGTYDCVAQSLEGRSYARWAPFKLTVVSITNFAFSSYGVPVSSFSTNKQGRFYLYADLVQQDGRLFGMVAAGPGGKPAYKVVSSDPNVVMVGTDNMGFYTFDAVGSGSANLTFTTPDGFTKNFPVTVTLPTSPVIDAAYSSPGLVDNSGTMTNVFTWHAVGGTINEYGMEGTGPYDTTDVAHSTDWSSMSWRQPVPAGQQPGTYYYYAKNNANGAVRGLQLTVVNAASRGQVAGNIIVGIPALSGMPYDQGSGDLEVYYNGSSAPIRTNSIWSHGGDYLASYLQPGNYKFRYISSNPNYLPTWYPAGTNSSDAVTVPVAAGTTVSNINFMLVPAVSASSALVSSDRNPDAPGQTVTFTAVVAGDFGVPAGTVTFLDGKNSLGSATLDSKGQATLTTSALALGEHAITVQYGGTNQYAASTSHEYNQQVILITTSKPVITRDPSGLAVRPGQPVQLQVGAAGATPMSYRWAKNGATIVGASNSTYSIASATTANAGTYLVIVTNIYGSATSSPALLVVDGVKPTITITAPAARVFTSQLTLGGKVSDDRANVTVWSQLNSNAWVAAQSMNGPWSQTITPLGGTNIFQVYAMDDAGNCSAIQKVSFFKVATDVLVGGTTGNGAIIESNKPFVTGLVRELGKTVTLTAKPVAGNILSSWEVQVGASNGVVPFKHDYNILALTMQSNLSVTANFVPNPFLTEGGDYAGLFQPPSYSDTNDVWIKPTDWTNAGMMTLTLTTNGTFSGQLTYKSVNYPFTGELDARGSNTISVARGKDPALIVTFQLMPGAAQIIGTVSQAGAWNAELWASRKMITKDTAFKGNYTVGIEGGPDNAWVAGALTLTVSPQGAVTVSGSMADGTAITQSRWLTTNGDFIIYQNLYGNKGMLLGYAHCDYDGQGELHWQKPAVPTDKLYKGGFSVNPMLWMSRFTAPAPGANATFWSTNIGGIVVSRGGLTNDLTGQLRLVKNVGVPFGTNNTVKSYSVTFDATKGTFAGTFSNPQDKNKVVPFKGVVLQWYGTNTVPQGSMNMGWWLGATNSGSVNIGQ